MFLLREQTQSLLDPDLVPKDAFFNGALSYLCEFERMIKAIGRYLTRMALLILDGDAVMMAITQISVFRGILCIRFWQRLLAG